MTNLIVLQTQQNDDFERNLQETARAVGVPVERMREMVKAFNAAIFTPPK